MKYIVRNDKFQKSKSGQHQKYFFLLYFCVTRNIAPEWKIGCIGQLLIQDIVQLVIVIGSGTMFK
jgi:hypothetical protein